MEVRISIEGSDGGSGHPASATWTYQTAPPGANPDFWAGEVQASLIRAAAGALESLQHLVRKRDQWAVDKALERLREALTPRGGADAQRP